MGEITLKGYLAWSINNQIGEFGFQGNNGDYSCEEFYHVNHLMTERK